MSIGKINLIFFFHDRLGHFYNMYSDYEHAFTHVLLTSN